MNNNTLFCHMSSQRLTKLINNAKHTVCYAGPGIQKEPASALNRLAQRVPPNMISVWIDFDERVMRMGYGDLEAVQILKESGIKVMHTPDLRSALIILDESEGYTFTPTPLYLEAEPDINVRNALRLSTEQIVEVLARLAPACKKTAINLAKTPEDKERIAGLSAEGNSTPLEDERINEVQNSLKVAPPVKFDLARQVRVYESYLQYVELGLSGAAIQRYRLKIPPKIMNIISGEDIGGRLKTTFDLLKGGKLSSKDLEKELNEIRNNFSPSLGAKYGRVVLKSVKHKLQKSLSDFRSKLEKYKKNVEKEIENELDKSKEIIVKYYLPNVMKNPPKNLLAIIAKDAPTEEESRRWLEREVKAFFPSANSLVKKIELEETYKDVTFETLNNDKFLELIKNAFPTVDWEKAHKEFKAAAES